MFEQAFRNIDDVLRKEAGCTTELDYTEQSSWLLFLKYLNELEQDKAMEAGLDGKKYSYILDRDYRWESWAAPKDKGGKLDHNAALTGDDLRDFVNQKLFPYLHGFKQRASGPNTIEYKIGEIFGEIKNKIQSGYNLREIIDHVDELRFRSQTEKHELSHLYEAKIKNMGNAGRNGGEYYTPRPLIRAMIQVVKPRLGEKIYDGACGSAGFLCESFDYLKGRGSLTTRDLDTLQARTFYEGVNLHSREIRKAHGDFAFMQVPAQRQAMLTALSELMATLPFTLFITAIRKAKHKERYGQDAVNPYDVALTYTFERVLHFLEGEGEISLPVTAEARGKNEDNELAAAFLRIMTEGTRYNSAERFRALSCPLTFRRKSDNIAGMQIADLCAHPAARKLLNPAQPNHAFDVIDRHIYRRDGVSGWKVFP